MNMSPESNSPDSELDLDFTKPGAIEGMEVRDYSSVEEKIAEEKRKIESAERGIRLARSIGDEDRIKQLEEHKMKFQETIALLQPEAQKVPSVAPGKDFDALVEQFPEGLNILKHEAVQRRNEKKVG